MRVCTGHMRLFAWSIMWLSSIGISLVILIGRVCILCGLRLRFLKFFLWNMGRVRGDWGTHESTDIQVLLDSVFWFCESVHIYLSVRWSMGVCFCQACKCSVSSWTGFWLCLVLVTPNYLQFSIYLCHRLWWFYMVQFCANGVLRAEWWMENSREVYMN